MNNEPYVRIVKRWDRNSGFAQCSWLHYVDIIGIDGEPLPINCHGRNEMGYYGMSYDKAMGIATKLSESLGLPLRLMIEERTVTTTLKEL